MTLTEYYEFIEQSLDAQLAFAHQGDWEEVKRVHGETRPFFIKNLSDFKAALATRPSLSAAENQIIDAIIRRITTKDKELFELTKAGNRSLSPKHLH